MILFKDNESMLPAIIFDLDGTLIDSAPDLAEALNRTLLEINRPALPLSLIRNLVGTGALALIKKGLEASGGIENNDLEALRIRFLEIYDKILLEKTKLFPGALKAIKNLTKLKYPLSICTNKPEVPAKKIIKGLGIKSYFKNISGGDTYQYKKPHPLHLIKTIKASGRRKNYAIMIGDSKNDIDCSKSLGIPSIVVSFGYSDIPVDQMEADMVLHNYDNLIRYIEILCNKYFNMKQ